MWALELSQGQGPGGGLVRRCRKRALAPCSSVLFSGDRRKLFSEVSLIGFLTRRSAGHAGNSVLQITVFLSVSVSRTRPWGGSVCAVHARHSSLRTLAVGALGKRNKGAGGEGPVGAERESE